MEGLWVSSPAMLMLQLNAVGLARQGNMPSDQLKSAAALERPILVLLLVPPPPGHLPMYGLAHVGEDQTQV